MQTLTDKVAVVTGAGRGVTANVIHPGEVKTAMWAAIRDESQRAGATAAPYRDWAESLGQSG